tara:strand:- start:3779 stop:5020 length:1242 start_codon:yes stop_codon:yes gene_type:complete
MVKPAFSFIVSIILFFSLSYFPSLTYAKETAETLYNNARNDYYSLKGSKRKQAIKSNWTKNINKFLSVSRHFPRSSFADDALFTAAMLYYDSFKQFGSRKDLNSSIQHYSMVVKKYSSSSLADDALFRTADIYFYDLRNYSKAKKAYTKITKKFSKGDMYKLALKRLNEISSFDNPRAPSRIRAKKIIVIDPGHGGKDRGAKGIKGLLEKNVVLDIALKLKKLIKMKLGYKVILTRNKDVFIPLEERTDIANANKADIFISIHANASKRKDASGIETYYLDFAKSDRALETAARENKVPLSNIRDDVQYILADMVANTKMNDSSQLAGIVQNNLIQGMRKKFKKVKDLQAKGGPFYVLHGANMPSVLVETSFISNPIEGKRLRSSKYRERLAYFILEGIEKYFRETQVAFKTK